MKCPYCVSDIPAEALVCAVCRRDLYLARPLLARIAELEAALAARQEMTSVETSAPAGGAVLAVDIANGPFLPTRSPGRAFLCWLAPLLLLVGGHALMFFVYDLPVLYLRLYALLLPLPFGYCFARFRGGHLVSGVVAAFVMAALAVLAMGGVTAAIDGVPILPQNTVEVREFIEFAASIGFSFLTGLWLCQWREGREARRRQARDQARSRHLGAVDSAKLAERLTRLNDLGSGLVTLATTGAAVYTGLKQILG